MSGPFDEVLAEVRRADFAIEGTAPADLAKAADELEVLFADCITKARHLEEMAAIDVEVGAEQRELVVTGAAQLRHVAATASAKSRLLRRLASGASPSHVSTEADASSMDTPTPPPEG